MTRRTMLQTAGGACAAAAFRSSARGATEAASPIMTKLSAYMSEAAGRALPEEALEKTKHHILDTFAAMVSGSELPPGRVAHQFARAHAGEKVATVAASDVLCGPIEAAMANGDAGAFRRNRRFARAFAFASRLRRGARCAGGRRTVRHRWQRDSCAPSRWVTTSGRVSP